MEKKLRIVFMGTPAFAVPCLDILVQNGYDIAGVITAPDKPAGRGQKLQVSAVKEYAIEKNLNILQPLKLKDPDFVEELRALNADLFIVVAFRMLPEIIWAMPPKGTFNLHGSLLPQYRGAAPINWAIINGETKTGVTTFFLQHEIDTGDVLFQVEIDILPTDNAGSLHDKMMFIGADLVLKTVEAIENGNTKGIPQVMSANIQHAPKIFKPDCQIDCNQPVETIHNKVRGLSPYPTAFTYLGEKVLKIFVTDFILSNDDAVPGTIDHDGKNYFRIKAADGWLDIKDLQLEGKKRLGVKEFLLGYR